MGPEKTVTWSLEPVLGAQSGDVTKSDVQGPTGLH